MSITPIPHHTPTPTPPNESSKPRDNNTPLTLKTKVSLVLALIGLSITLVMTNLTIKNYETHLTTAEEVLLELAPVDPRSLMQGDYMALNYAIAEPIMAAIEAQEVAKGNLDYVETLYNISQDGSVIIKKDAQGVGHFVRLAQHSGSTDEPLAQDEMLLQYRIRHGQLKIATNAFFFQEGQAEAFEQAKYGMFRINEQGKPLLTDMVDKRFKVIEPKKVQSQQTDNSA